MGMIKGFTPLPLVLLRTESFSRERGGKNRASILGSPTVYHVPDPLLIKIILLLISPTPGDRYHHQHFIGSKIYIKK